MSDPEVLSVLRRWLRHGHPSTLHLWWARRSLAVSCVDRIAGGGLPEERA